MTAMVANGSWDVREKSYAGDPLSVVGIGLDEDTCRFLSVFADSSAMIRMRSQLGSVNPEMVAEHLGQPSPDVCLIDFDRNRRNAVALAESIHSSKPGTAIFAVSSQSNPNAILEAMRCGCSEYLVRPIDRNQLISAIMRVGARRQEKVDRNRGQLLAFMGAKGGCGVTTLVTQFGALLASTLSRSSLLVDLHPDFGDAALYLKLTKPRYHFLELLENADRLDADFLDSFLIKHSSGLELIPAPEGSLATSDGLPTGALSRTLTFLRSRYEFVLADLPPSWNEQNLAVIRECDQLYLVAVAEVSAVRNIVRQLQYLTAQGIPRDKIRVVMNRHHKRNVVSDDQIEKVIEQKIYWRVPNEYPAVVKAIHEGDPIAQRRNSDVTRSLEEWAKEIGKKPDESSYRKEGGGFLGLWNK
jgi:pilus assembly protein CpaE